MQCFFCDWYHLKWHGKPILGEFTSLYIDLGVCMSTGSPRKKDCLRLASASTPLRKSPPLCFWKVWSKISYMNIFVFFDKANLGSLLKVFAVYQPFCTSNCWVYVGGGVGGVTSHVAFSPPDSLVRHVHREPRCLESLLLHKLYRLLQHYIVASCSIFFSYYDLLGPFYCGLLQYFYDPLQCTMSPLSNRMFL